MNTGIKKGKILEEILLSALVERDQCEREKYDGFPAYDGNRVGLGLSPFRVVRCRLLFAYVDRGIAYVCGYFYL
jgi:hypothetical protein